MLGHFGMIPLVHHDSRVLENSEGVMKFAQRNLTLLPSLFSPSLLPCFPLDLLRCSTVISPTVDRFLKTFNGFYRDLMGFHGFSRIYDLFIYICVCIYIYVYIYTGRTKVALVELPTVNMFGFFFCTPFPRRILAWSFVVPRHTCHTKRTWKCHPQLTETDVLQSFKEE